MSANWIKRSYESLYGQCTQTGTYLEDKFGDFGIDGKSAEWINKTFMPALDAYTSAFNAWKDKSQRTPIKVATIQRARAVLEPIYRELYAFLKSNPVVTDADLLAMALPKRPAGTRTPVPVPATFPVPNIEISTIRQLTLHFVDSASGKKGRPYGIAGAVIRWAMLEQPPTSVEMLNNTLLDTKTPYMLTFTESERHKTVYFCLCWQNTRGETGAWSEIISAVIP